MISRKGNLSPMELVLAMDLRGGQVVHGEKGDRASYRPLQSCLVTTADPVPVIGEIRPRSLYIADLDRIEGKGSQDRAILYCAGLVDRCYVDRGCRNPDDILRHPKVVNVVGTETAGSDLSQYRGGFLSVDIKHGRVIPSGRELIPFLCQVAELSFDGCILLNLGAVGTGRGLPPDVEKLRAAYPGRLLYGGGIAGPRDLDRLDEAGYDGALVATALHRGAIPIEWIRRGARC